MITDKLLNGNFGIFNHYLCGSPDWVKTTNALDIPKMAAQIASTGASRYCITLMQGSRYMLAPNETYDRIAGTKPGEACCVRDVPYELGKELEKYGIDLYLYYTGDGPWTDDVIGRRFGFIDPRKNVPMDFVEKWASVLREYAVRYGSLVKGWWIDGCYRRDFGYNDDLLTPYYEACKAGNPECLVAMNNGCPENEPEKNYCKEDYTCGEIVDFITVPSSSTVDGAQMHILTPLGMPPDGGNYYDSWCRTGLKRDAAYLTDYIRKLKAVPCALTIDIIVYPDGSFDPEQIETLKKVSALLENR